MSVLKNKHMVIATLMAPVLALMAYFGVNFMLSETPQVAEEGQSYQLVEKPNCRYGSGACGLKNNDFELTLTFDWQGSEKMLLTLESVYPLEGVLLAMVEDSSEEQAPVEMRPVGADGLNWVLDLARPDPERNRLYIVASSGGVLYFGDAATKFTLVETTNY